MPTTVSVNCTIKLKDTIVSSNIRDGYSTSAKIVGFMSPGETVKATKKCNGWYYIPSKTGWVSGTLVTVVSHDGESTAKSKTPEEVKKEVKNAVDINESDLAAIEQQQADKYEAEVNAKYSGSSVKSEARNMLTSNLSAIYGIPYQFSELVDPRMTDSKGKPTEFGALYAERIIARMPLLILSPGKVDFMSGYSAGEKQSVLDAVAGVNNGSATAIGQFLSKPGKYYSFVYDKSDYWNYVNTMNHACAVYLGIQDLEINLHGKKGKLINYKWEKATNDKLNSWLLSNQNYICFYADADSSDSESFGNGVTDSQLASKVNGYSEIAREVKFLVGTQTGANWLDETLIGEANNAVKSISERLLGGNAVFENIGKEFAVIATGGKLIFPQIWSDSTFSQTFNAKIKLRCPCPNPLQWYLDICVPLNHLIALTMPRTPRGKTISGKNFDDEPSANGYMSPFLVRGFYKGIFNCDMGIITDLNISKGKEGSWSIDSLPSEVDVDITIKDLYNVMAMTPEDQQTEFLNNTTFLNYLANNCGISINKPDLHRSIDLWMMINHNAFFDKLTGYNLWRQMTTDIQNNVMQVYQRFFKG